MTIWLAGNQEAAYRLEGELFLRGCMVHVLAEERNGKELVDLARVLSAAGLITICTRRTLDPSECEQIRKSLGEDRFVYLDASKLGGSAEEVAAVARRTRESPVSSPPASEDRIKISVPMIRDLRIDFWAASCRPCSRLQEGSASVQLARLVGQ